MVANLLPFSIFYSTVLGPLLYDGGSVKFRHYSGSADERYDLEYDYHLDEHRDLFFSRIKPTHPTVMYMHGYLGDKSVARQFCNATHIEYEGKVNCIIIDWAIVSHHANYYLVKNDMKQVRKNYEFSI